MPLKKVSTITLQILTRRQINLTQNLVYKNLLSDLVCHTHSFYYLDLIKRDFHLRDLIIAINKTECYAPFFIKHSPVLSPQCPFSSLLFSGLPGHHSYLPLDWSSCSRIDWISWPFPAISL
jgi:hypothetical protein